MRKSSHAKLTNYARRSMMFPLVHHTEQLLLKGQFRLFTQAQTSSTQKDIIKICFGVREDLFSSLRQGFRAQKPLYESLSLSISLKCCFCPEQLESKWYWISTKFNKEEVKVVLYLTQCCCLVIPHEWISRMNESNEWLNDSFIKRVIYLIPHKMNQPFERIEWMTQWLIH